MKEFFRDIGFGLLWLVGGGAFATPVIMLVTYSKHYPVTVGVPCLLFYVVAAAWLIGRIGRESA